MWIISVFMLLFCIFFILTRIVYVRIIINNGIKIELHFPVTAIVFSISNNYKTKESAKNKGRFKIPLSEYPKLIKKFLRLIDNSRINIRHLSLPRPDDESRIYKYDTLFYALSAVLKQKSKDLILNDNAFILFPDTEKIRLDIIFKLRLYLLVNFILSTWYGLVKVKLVKRSI